MLQTKESNETLRQLTQQAVQFQRRMQDASKGTTNLAQLLPINVSEMDRQVGVTGGGGMQ